MMKIAKNNFRISQIMDTVLERALPINTANAQQRGSNNQKSTGNGK